MLPLNPKHTAETDYADTKWSQRAPLHCQDILVPGSDQVYSYAASKVSRSISFMGCNTYGTRNSEGHQHNNNQDLELCPCCSERKGGDSTVHGSLFELTNSFVFFGANSFSLGHSRPFYARATPQQTADTAGVGRYCHQKAFCVWAFVVLVGLTP